MKGSIALMAGAVVVMAALSEPALSQGTPQTAAIMKVDPQTVATGYRTSKVVAAPSSTKQTRPSGQSTI